MMSKVVLINPPWIIEKGFGVRSNSRWPHIRKDKVLPFPIYLSYTASVLEKNGITVKVFDAVALEYTINTLICLVKDEKPKYVFIESSTPTIEQDLANARRLKEEVQAETFLMGPHATVFHDKLLETNDFLDGIIRGEFEYTVRDIALGIPREEINGLTFRRNDSICITRDRPSIQNLDELPFPAWHQFDLRHYDSFIHRHPSMMMVTSRGCPFQCNYCLWPDIMYGHRQRYRSALNVCDEIELIIKRYGVREIKFDDDTFALNKEHVISICNEILRRGYNKKIIWNCFGHISQSDDNMYTKMAVAGCRKISFGVESGSKKILDAIKKVISLEKAKRVINTCRKLGIETHCDFMIGFPYEDLQDIQKSIEVAINLDPDFIQVTFVVPYPGTRMYNQGLQEGFLRYPNKWGMYASCIGMVDNQNVTPDDLQKMYNQFWKRFYLRPRYVIRMTGKMLRSKHEFLRIAGGLKSFYQRFVR